MSRLRIAGWTIEFATIALALVACAEHPEKPDDPCKKPYAGTILACAKPQPRSTAGMVKLCRVYSRSDARCEWISREEVERILRSME